MPECDYCGETFASNDALDEHLLATHRDELGRIDRRRLDLAGDDGGEEGVSAGIVMLGAVMALALIAVGAAMYLTSGSDGGGADGPTNVGGVHYHGTMDVVIDGESVDFSQPKYQYSNTGEDAFHYEAGDGSQWHVHANRVTLAYAMDSLGIPVNATSVTYEGTTYRDGDGDTTVTITVNGEPVTPSDYVLQEGDHVRIVVEQS